MTPEDRKYLAYLATFIADRIVTAIYQGQTETRIFEAKAEELRDEAHTVCCNFYPKDEAE